MKRSTCTLALTAIALCGTIITPALSAADDKWYAQADLGVSLVNNYRTQFSDILAKSSFEWLMKRLREKTAE